MPGLVDTHIHAPQYPNAGKGLDVGLLEWLKKYTFPTEARFKDLKFAEMAYRKAVVRTVINEPPRDKSNKMSVRPAKTQISPGIRPV